MTYSKKNLMEACYDYFGCTNKECRVFLAAGSLSCWDAEGTPGTPPGLYHMKPEDFTKERNKCSYCIYFNHARDREAFAIKVLKP